MKNVFLMIFIALMFCSCSSGNINQAEEQTEQKEKEPIPAFESEKREILPLPKNFEITDSMEFVDSLIADYEVMQFTEFDKDFELRDMELEKSNDGYVFKSQKSGSAVSFNKPLKEYFNTPDSNYGVLVRFKTEDAENLNFNFDGKFGRIMLDFTDGIYPAIDVSGDSYGDPMFTDDWNNYTYELGEWAYVFITISNLGQKSCYIWGEDEPSNYNFKISYGDSYGDDRPFSFDVHINKKGKTVTVSDIWLYSYEEAKR